MDGGVEKGRNNGKMRVSPSPRDAYPNGQSAATCGGANDV